MPVIIEYDKEDDEMPSESLHSVSLVKIISSLARMISFVYWTHLPMVQYT